MVESEAKGNGFGKGSDRHTAVVVGDTVGDPFKDTSGPALNILSKLMSHLSLIISGSIATEWGNWKSMLIIWTSILIGSIIYVVWKSKKSSENIRYQAQVDRSPLLELPQH